MGWCVFDWNEVKDVVNLSGFLFDVFGWLVDLYVVRVFYFFCLIMFGKYVNIVVCYYLNLWCMVDVVCVYFMICRCY